MDKENGLENEMTKKPFPVQYGLSLTCDFRETTWTFEMFKGFGFTGGKFAIVPDELWEQTLQLKKQLEKLQEENKRLSQIITDRTNEICEGANELGDLDERIKKLEKVKDGYKNLCAGKGIQIQVLDAQLKSSQEETSLLKSQIHILEAQLNAANDEAKVMYGEIERLKGGRANEIAPHLFRQLFDELINAGRDMRDRDRLQLPYMPVEDYFKDVQKRYSSLANQSAAGWISVDERLPDEFVHEVLVRKHIIGLFSHEVVSYGIDKDNGGLNCFWEYHPELQYEYPVTRVTHWMPLPQPPSLQENTKF